MWSRRCKPVLSKASSFRRNSTNIWKNWALLLSVLAPKCFLFCHWFSYRSGAEAPNADAQIGFNHDCACNNINHCNDHWMVLVKVVAWAELLRLSKLFLWRWHEAPCFFHFLVSQYFYVRYSAQESYSACAERVPGLSRRIFQSAEGDCTKGLLN